MVEPSKRTRSTKKKKVRTPGGKTVTHFGRKKSGKAECGLCSKNLSGVATGTATAMKNTAKTKKMPSKPYAGVLCPECLDSLMRYQTRIEAKFSSEDLSDLDIRRDLRLEKYLPRGWYEDASAGKVKKKAVKSKPVKKAEAKPKSPKKTVKKKTAKKKAGAKRKSPKGAKKK